MALQDIAPAAPMHLRSVRPCPLTPPSNKPFSPTELAKIDKTLPSDPRGVHASRLVGIERPRRGVLLHEQGAELVAGVTRVREVRYYVLQCGVSPERKIVSNSTGIYIASLLQSQTRFDSTRNKNTKSFSLTP